MRFSKDGELYRVVRITGAQDNIIGVVLSDEACITEAFAYPSSSGSARDSVVRTTVSEILGQVKGGLDLANAELKNEYFIGKVFYIPHERPSRSVYKMMIHELIRRIDRGDVA